MDAAVSRLLTIIHDNSGLRGETPAKSSFRQLPQAFPETVSRNPWGLHIPEFSQLWPVTPVDAIDGICVNACLRILDKCLRNPTED